MGGVLVSRNQISVAHRYTQAGKWKEASIEHKPSQPAVVAEADELKVAPSSTAGEGRLRPGLRLSRSRLTM